MNETPAPALGSRSAVARWFGWRDGAVNLGVARQRVAEAALGHVLELGGDNGANLFLYPRAITSLTSLVTARKSSPGVRRSSRQLSFPVDRRTGSLSEFPLKDHAYDTVISTLALCTTPTLSQTLVEIRRVLKIGGRLLFLEYGLSAEEGVARWQRRCAPLHRLLSGAHQPLHFIDQEIMHAGFALKHVQCEYLERRPRALGCLYEGVAFNGD
jgi:SAM-dependent methyltransferase